MTDSPVSAVRGTLTEVLVNISENMFGDGNGPAYQLMYVFCLVGGLTMVLRALIKFPRAAAAGPMGMHNPYAAPMASLVLGIVLISMGSTMNTFTNTLFEGDASRMRYSDGNVTYANVQITDIGPYVNTIVDAVLNILAFLGWLWTIKGLFVLKAAAEGTGQAGVGTGITHIVGGVLAVNMGPFLVAIESTLDIGEFVTSS